MCVPDNSGHAGESTLRRRLVAEIHNNAMAIHMGTARTIQELQKRAYWPNLTRDVKEYIAECEGCQRNKGNTKTPMGLGHPLQIPSRPGTHYSIDFLTGIPKAGTKEHDAIMVVVDRYSKKLRAIPTWKKADAKLTAELFLNNVVWGPDGNGAPIEIVSDRDSKFTPTNSKSKDNGFWRDFFGYIGTSIVLSTSRHQRTDGQTERMIKHLTEVLRMGIDWTALLPRVVFSINNSVAAATGFSPFYVERGRDPLIPLDRDKAILDRVPEREDTKEFAARIWSIERQVNERLTKASHHNMLSMDEKARHLKGLKVGDKAWLSTEGITMPWDRHRPSNKLKAKFYGPFEILEQTSPVTFRLKLPATVNIHPIFHAGLLKAHSGKGRPVPMPAPDKEGEYEIEKILGHRRRKDGKRVYLVKWKGYTYEESTWEPAAHFKSQTLQAYHAKCKEDKAEQTDSSSEDDEDEQAPSKQSKKGKRSSRQQALANLSCTSQTGGQRQGPIEDTPRMNGSHQEPIRESKHHATYGSQDHRIPPHKSGHEQPGSIHQGTRFLG